MSDKCIICPNCGRKIAEQKPVEPEIEGGGYSWFYVCGECHGSINSYDKYCRHCGREIDWSNDKTDG